GSTSRGPSRRPRCRSSRRSQSAPQTRQKRVPRRTRWTSLPWFSFSVRDRSTQTISRRLRRVTRRRMVVRSLALAAQEANARIRIATDPLRDRNEIPAVVAGRLQEIAFHRTGFQGLVDAIRSERTIALPSAVDECHARALHLTDAEFESFAHLQILDRKI